MSHFFLRSACAVLLPVLAGGCATTGDSTQQQLEVHTILDNREVAGVGCVLENDAGRWFVVAPGRVTVERSRLPLTVDCRRDGVGESSERVGSRYANDNLVGGVASAGVGYYLDRRSGAGFSYPATLTVILRGAPARQGGDGQPPVAADNLVF
ncbi:hypothetical protein [uncultured Massilia sp.]|uniref:hypothetical protein n=1 Tax=uncultured Massilia sp. TaxID=169973 RepID=UPI0025CBBFD3|nr:hypothetical protein [uncultured Massilia sp.]